MDNLLSILNIIRDHGIPCDLVGDHIEVRAYMDNDEISDVITYDDGIIINGKPDNLRDWLGY